jgi:hypothetical protein
MRDKTPRHFLTTVLEAGKLRVILVGSLGIPADAHATQEVLMDTQTPPAVPLVQPSMALESADPAAIAAAESARQRLQAAFTVAKRFPRDVDQARHRILSACRRPRFAELVEYKKPIGRGHIVGPSIRFAEECLREWGNIIAETNVVFEDEESRRLAVTVIDLETNTRFLKEIRIAKYVERKDKKGRTVISQRLNSYNETVYKVEATEDELLTKEAALISKVLRNEGLRCIPQDIIDEAIDAARATMSGQYTEDPDAARKKLLDAFASVRVSPKMLEDYLGHKTDTISLDEWNDLRRLFRTVKEGAMPWREIVERHKARLKPETDLRADDSDDDSDPTTGA